MCMKTKKYKKTDEAHDTIVSISQQPVAKLP